ncbi:MAG: holo-ACP synthase [Verrucomicrobiota bacterium]
MTPPSNFPLMSPGIDLVEVPRLAAVMERGGAAFLRRVFTEAEAAYCQGHRDPAPHFAARFAAKEAVAKALGTGLGEAAAFREIEVIRSAAGAPGIVLHGAAAATAAAQGIVSIQVSLTHTDRTAAAMVLVTRGG